MKLQVLLPAAGSGARLGHDLPKALVPLAGAPILAHTLRRFQAMGLLERVPVIAAPPGMLSMFAESLTAHFPGQTPRLLPGGAERQDSVRLGLDALDSGVEIVVIHDAARPFPPEEAVREAAKHAAECGAATVAIRVTDTILREDGAGFLESTPDRGLLWACQTPQVFRVEVIREAHARAAEEGFAGTDDASLVRRMGAAVKLVAGSPLNLKITTPADLAFANMLLREKLA